MYRLTRLAALDFEATQKFAANERFFGSLIKQADDFRTVANMGDAEYVAVLHQ